MTVLSLEEANKLNLPSDELFLIAINNVVGLMTEMEFDPREECFVISSNNLFYASSVLLMDYVWKQASTLIEGDIVAAVPARDTVLFTGSDNAAGLRQIREETDYVVANGHHIVSRTLLRRVGETWKVFS